MTKARTNTTVTERIRDRFFPKMAGWRLLWKTRTLSLSGKFGRRWGTDVTSMGMARQPTVSAGWGGIPAGSIPVKCYRPLKCWYRTSPFGNPFSAPSILDAFYKWLIVVEFLNSKVCWRILRRGAGLFGAKFFPAAKLIPPRRRPYGGLDQGFYLRHTRNCGIVTGGDQFLAPAHFVPANVAQDRFYDQVSLFKLV